MKSFTTQPENFVSATADQRTTLKRMAARGKRQGVVSAERARSIFVGLSDKRFLPKAEASREITILGAMLDRARGKAAEPVAA